MQTTDILKKARQIISDPSMWCKDQFFKGIGLQEARGQFAETGKHPPCCAYGAILVAAGFNSDLEQPAYHKLAASTPSGSVLLYNDASTTTHADILSAFDAAIEKEHEVCAKI